MHDIRQPTDVDYWRSCAKEARDFAKSLDHADAKRAMQRFGDYRELLALVGAQMLAEKAIENIPAAGKDAQRRPLKKTSAPSKKPVGRRGRRDYMKKLEHEIVPFGPKDEPRK